VRPPAGVIDELVDRRLIVEHRPLEHLYPTVT
jgi:hypothetical protein